MSPQSLAVPCCMCGLVCCADTALPPQNTLRRGASAALCHFDVSFFALCALTLGTLLPHCRFNTVSKEYTAIQKQLEKANEEFKEFERKDIKFRQASGTIPGGRGRPASQPENHSAGCCMFHMPANCCLAHSQPFQTQMHMEQHQAGVTAA